MQGLLIVFEGVEGSGKTTQMQRCLDWLQVSGIKSCLDDRQELLHSPLALSRRHADPIEKTPVVATREPGGTALGMSLRQLLLEKHSYAIQDRAELLMYAADRAQHVEEFLKPHLELGAIVLCDRFTDSTIAYQGYGRRLDLNLIQQLNKLATDGLESDLTLWLDIDVETGLRRARQRGAADRIEQADIEFHRRVHQGFVRLAASYPQRIVRVDANKSEEEVHLAIQEIVRQRLSAWFQTLSPYL